MRRSQRSRSSNAAHGGRRKFRVAILLAAALFPASTADALSLGAYDGGVGAIVLDPVTFWGWAPVDFGAGGVGTPVVNDLMSGLNAWQVDDLAAAPNGSRYSWCCIDGPLESFAVEQGWRFSATVRLLEDYSTAGNGQGGPGLIVWLNNKNYTLRFDLASNDLRAVTFQSQTAMATHTITSGGTGRSAYHNVALVYNPVSQSAWVEVNGMRVLAAFGLSDTSHPHAIQWGNPSFDRGKMNFRTVNFEITVPGDFNLDGVVNGLDYAVWRNRLGTAFGAADANGSGMVDAADFTIWKNNYGNADLEFGSADTASIPEPSAAIIFMTTLATICVGRTRRFAAK